MAEPQCPVLTLYSRHYCHLCDEMLAGLQSMQSVLGFELTVVDVDSQPALEAVYGERVPVLAHGQRELCHYRLDRPAVTEYLRKFR
ncbi:MAG: glutaredoxin family protein [Burkholderiales bacterium]